MFCLQQLFFFSMPLIQPHYFLTLCKHDMTCIVNFEPELWCDDLQFLPWHHRPSWLAGQYKFFFSNQRTLFIEPTCMNIYYKNINKAFKVHGPHVNFHFPNICAISHISYHWSSQDHNNHRHHNIRLRTASVDQVQWRRFPWHGSWSARIAWLAAVSRRWWHPLLPLSGCGSPRALKNHVKGWKECYLFGQFWEVILFIKLQNDTQTTVKQWKMFCQPHRVTSGQPDYVMSTFQNSSRMWTLSRVKVTKSI